MTSRLANLSSVKAAKKIGASLSSLATPRSEAKNPQQVEEEEEDEDEDSEEEEDEEKRTVPTAKSKQISIKDLDWSQEEQQTVLKHYGLDSIFPNVWGDDAYQGRLQGGDRSVADIKAVMQEQDNADPLKIKGKVVRRRAYHKKGENSPSVFISEKAFSPKFFLLEVHKSTEYKELEQGAARLKQTIAERSETTKEQIKRHFSKFVSAKSTVDSFYSQMKTKNLISREDYGIAPFLRKLDSLQAEAHNLYGPVLERRSKADKIRITLSILEQWKFFFNLASSLKEMIRKGKYDAAVRDYKKGKSIMQSSFSNDEAARQVGNDKFGKDTSNLLPKNYQGVFEKLWVEVERVAKDCRDELFRSLRVMTNPVETQEKVINYLVDLDSKRDPVWCYLDTQYNWVLDSLVKVYNKHIFSMKGALKRMKDTTTSKIYEGGLVNEPSAQSMDNLASRDYLNSIKVQIDVKLSENLAQEDIRPSVAWDLNDVKKALMSVADDSFEAHFGTDMVVHLWKCTLHFVQELCNVLETHLPAFWRTCRMYSEGKIHRKDALKKANIAKRKQEGQTMVGNIFEIVQLMTNYSFLLLIDDDDSIDDNSLSESSEEVEFGAQKLNDEKEIILPPLKNLSAYGSKPQLDAEMDEESQQVWQTFQKVSDSLEQLSPNEFAILLKAHPIILVYYSTKIMAALRSTTEEIKPFYGGDDGSTIFQSFSTTVESVKTCLVTNICKGMVQVFSSIHTFEDWSFENHRGIKPSTLHAKHDSTHLMKICYKIKKFILRSMHGIIQFSEKSEDNNAIVEIIRVSFFDSLFSLLDGFQWQASQWRDPGSAIHFENVAGWVPDLEHVKLKTFVPEQKIIFGQFVPPECSNYVETFKPKNYCDQDSRNFMVLCNIIYLKKWMFPVTLESLEDKFKVKATLDAQHFEEMIDFLENIVISNYVKRQSQSISMLVKTAILYSGLDWASVHAPREIRPYCFHILHHLVNIHASISEVSKSLIANILSELLIVLAQELLLAFRCVDKYSVAGMLQATLETEFLDSTLKSFETPVSEAIFTQIYETLEKGTDIQDVIEPAKMNEHLVAVKSFLNLAKTSSITQFRCFSDEEHPIDWT